MGSKCIGRILQNLFGNIWYWNFKINSKPVLHHQGDEGSDTGGSKYLWNVCQFLRVWKHDIPKDSHLDIRRLENHFISLRTLDTSQERSNNTSSISETTALQNILLLHETFLFLEWRMFNETKTLLTSI
jgi:hypothetical protein